MSPTDLPRAEPAPREPLSKSAWLASALLVLVVWIARWHFPEASAAPILDASFMQALGHALVHGQQFGTDIVFTYGPLGWFNVGQHQPELFWTKCLAWEFAFKLGIALFFGAAALRLRSKLAVALFAFALVVPEYGFDASWFIAILAIAAWSLDRVDRPVAWLALPFGALALIALVKFTYTSLALFTVFVIVVDIARVSVRRAALAAVLFIALFSACWTFAGQSWEHIPRWIATSAELASAFSAAMSMSATNSVFALALLSGALVIAAIVLRGGRGRSLALAVVALATLFVAFRAGFTRATGNEITFFGVAAVVPFLLGDAEHARRVRAFTIARVLALAVAFTGFCAASGEHGENPIAIVRSAISRCAQNVRTAVTLPTLRQIRDEERIDTARKFAVPRLTARIGKASVDVFASEQGLAFLHDWNWHPRPVFQSYSVFTDALSAANARFLSSDDAPRFVVFRPGTIDERLANSEDARSLRVLIRDYRLAAEERGFMLFERDVAHAGENDDARETEPSKLDSIVLERDVALGETLFLDPVAGDVLVIEIEAALELSGRVRSAIVGAPRLDAIVVGADGASVRNRIVPELVRGGVVVRPWLSNLDDWMRWYLGEPTRAIRSIRFVATDGGFHDRIHVRVMRAQSLRPRRETGDDARFRYSMMVDAPSAVVSAEPTRRTVFRGFREALVVSAPSSIHYEREPGAYDLGATFGFEPEAWRNGETDGVIVRVDRVARDGSRTTAWSRSLDPKHDAKDGREQSLRVTLDIAAGEHVELVVDPGLANDARRDWIFWSNVELVRRTP